jgi:hypothetical protein
LNWEDGYRDWRDVCLGKEAARHFVGLGASKVILAAQSIEKVKLQKPIL